MHLENFTPDINRMHVQYLFILYISDEKYSIIYYLSSATKKD